MPPYPTETEVIVKAQTLNGFVSNISEPAKPAKKS
jgi:hypothetical protein